MCEKNSVFLIPSDNSPICFLRVLPYTTKSQLSLPGIFFDVVGGIYLEKFAMVTLMGAHD